MNFSADSTSLRVFLLIRSNIAWVQMKKSFIFSIAPLNEVSPGKIIIRSIQIIVRSPLPGPEAKIRILQGNLCTAWFILNRED